MSIFEKASRIKLRYTTPKGNVKVEDLWDLPLSSSVGNANLDDIAKELNRTLKDTETESFVHKSTAKDPNVQLAFDIVKHVIEVRLAENEAANLARANKEKKQQLLALIAQKETEQLAGQSLEELRKQVENM